MFRMLRVATCAGLLTFSAGFSTTVSAAELDIVASFSIIGDFARNVGGDRVAITTLVGPDGDAHVYEPRPADAAALQRADVILVNGLGFEGFIGRLVEASGAKAPVVEVSQGITPLKASEDEHHHEAGGHEGHDHAGHHHHGEFDPHAWQSVRNAEIYVKNIADAFCKADKAGCPIYTANAAAYTAKLADLDKEVRDAIGAIPAGRRTIITSHDAFGYFERDYGLRFIAPEGVSTESEASASDVAKLIEQVKEDKASAIFLENITNPRLIEQIATETGLKVGGTLYSDALSGKDGPASTYVDLFRYNIRTLKAAIPAS